MGALFGESVVFLLVFGVFIAFALWPVWEAMLAPTVPEVALPESLKLTLPLEKRHGGYETRIHLDGEMWRATFPDDGLPPPLVGDLVSIAGRDGLEIHLERYERAT